MRFNWKTILGAAVSVIGIVSSPEILAVLPDSISLAVQGVGLLLAAVGGKAVEKK